MTISRAGRLAVAALTAAMLLGGSAAGVFPPLRPAVTFTVAGIATDPMDAELNPEIDGRLVAWQSADRDCIVVRDIRTNQTRTIGEGDGGKAQRRPDVSGDYVVYEDNSAGDYDIKCYSWNEDSSFTVVATAQNEMEPRIDGNLVVWRIEETGNVWYRDLDARGGTHQLAASSTPPYFDVDNGRIAVMDADFTHVYTPRAPGGLIYAGMGDPEVTQLRAHGDRFAHETYDGDDFNALWADIRSGKDGVVAAEDGTNERAPVPFHTTFAWGIPGAGGSDIGYSLPGHANSTVGTNRHDSDPSLFGGRIAFGASGGPDTDVMLATGAKLMGRTAGADRYETAAKLSKAYFSAADHVVLCTGENFPDALAAVPLARSVQGPLLLTRKDSIPAVTLSEIARLVAGNGDYGNGTIHVIGGTPTISTVVTDQLSALGYTVERIAGDDRYETSALIARKLQTIPGIDASHVFRAFFTRGDNFPDALAVGPVAAGALAPVLLVRTTSVPASVAEAVDDMNITQGWIVGDEASVSGSTALALRGALIANGGVAPERWAGPNRYDTAATVVNGGLAHRWIDLDTLGVAVGTKFPDALGGGAALGYYGSPVVLTNGTALSPATSAFLAGHEYEIGRVDVFGDTNSVSKAVYDTILAKIK